MHNVEQRRLVRWLARNADLASALHIQTVSRVEYRGIGPPNKWDLASKPIRSCIAFDG